jgi:hypothetical protein
MAADESTKATPFIRENVKIELSQIKEEVGALNQGMAVEKAARVSQKADGNLMMAAQLSRGDLAHVEDGLLKMDEGIRIAASRISAFDPSAPDAKVEAARLKEVVATLAYLPESGRIYCDDLKGKVSFLLGGVQAPVDDKLAGEIRKISAELAAAHAHAAALNSNGAPAQLLKQAQNASDKIGPEVAKYIETFMDGLGKINQQLTEANAVFKQLMAVVGSGSGRSGSVSDRDESKPPRGWNGSVTPGKPPSSRPGSGGVEPGGRQSGKPPSSRPGSGGVEPGGSQSGKPPSSRPGSGGVEPGGSQSGKPPSSRPGSGGVEPGGRQSGKPPSSRPGSGGVEPGGSQSGMLPSS